MLCLFRWEYAFFVHKANKKPMLYSEDQYIQEVCKNIKRIRKEKGLTQKDVAFACNMEEPTYRRVENGNTNPTLRTLIKISKALHIEMVELFDFSRIEGGF